MANPYEASTRRGSALRPTTTDPILRCAWREALVVFALWGTAMAWSVGYCAIHAYPGKDRLAEAADQLTYTLGFPTWVFYGIVLPWVVCAVLSFFISRFVITNEDLGIDPDEALQEIIDG